MLVFSFHAPPERAVGGLRWWGFSRYLAALGWEIRTITASAGAEEVPVPAGNHVEHVPRLTTLEDRYRGWRRSRRTPRGRNSTSGGTVTDGASPSGDPGTASSGEAGRGGLRRLASDLLSVPDHGRGWILRAAMVGRRAVREFEPDVIVSTGPPHSVHLAARLARSGTRIQWVLDLRDPWATHFRPNNGDGWTGGLREQLESMTIPAADLVLTTTPELREGLAKRFSDSVVEWLPNGVDLSSLPDRGAERFQGLSLSHVGSLSYRRDPRPAISAFSSFLARNRDAEEAGSALRFVGGATPDFAAGLSQLRESLGIRDHVKMLGLVSREDALEVLCRSTVALVLAQDQDFMVPAKIYEAVALGIPALILTQRGSATANEGERLGAAVFEPDDEEGVVDYLEGLWSAARVLEADPPSRISQEHLAGTLDASLRQLLASRDGTGGGA
ncbi:MAG: glycosyltransferase [Gemmatimonadota bacterium]